MAWIKENKLIIAIMLSSGLLAITTSLVCNKDNPSPPPEVQPLPLPEPEPDPTPPEPDPFIPIPPPNPQPTPPSPNPDPDIPSPPPNPSPQPNPEPQIIVPTPLCKQGWILLRMSLESTRDYFSEHQEGCLWCNWKLQKYLCEVGRTLFKDYNTNSKFKEHCKTCYKCRKYVGEVYVRN